MKKSENKVAISVLCYSDKQIAEIKKGFIKTPRMKVGDILTVYEHKNKALWFNRFLSKLRTIAKNIKNTIYDGFCDI
jgi:hypothetical protein